MSDDIKVSFVRSKNTAETFAIQRKKFFTAKGYSLLYLLLEEVRCHFHELSNDQFRMYFKEDRDIMVIATNDDVQRFIEMATVPRIFVIKTSDVDGGQYLKYIINYQ